jgi:ankyrin repeat protein
MRSMKWVLCILMFLTSFTGFSYSVNKNAKQKELDKQLLEAATSGTVEEVQRLIEAGADINALDSYKKSPIFLATGSNDKAVVEFLANHGSDLELQTEYHHCRKPLCLAIHKRDLEKVKILVAAGAKDVSHYLPWAFHWQLYFNWQTPVQDNREASENRFSIVEILLDNNADVTYVDASIGNALYNAISVKAPARIIKKLIDLGSDVDVAVKTGITEICYNQGTYCIDPKYGSKPEDGRTALMAGIKQGVDQDIIELILSNTKNIDLMDEIGETALVTAVKLGRVEMLKSILRLKPNVDQRSRGPLNMTPLMHSMAFREPAVGLEMAKLLVAAGSDPCLKYGKDLPRSIYNMFCPNLEGYNIYTLCDFVMRDSDLKKRIDLNENICTFLQNHLTSTGRTCHEEKEEL